MVNRRTTMEDYTPTHQSGRGGTGGRTGADFSAVYDYTQEVILRHSRHQTVQWGGVSPHGSTNGGTHTHGFLHAVSPTVSNCSNCLPVTYRAPLSPPGLEYSHDPGDTTSTQFSVWNTSGFLGNDTTSTGGWLNGSGAGGNGSVDGAGAQLVAGHLVQDVALGVILGTLSMLTFVGNAMVLHAVRTEKRLQSVSNMFIISLAIADLIVGLIVMPISAIYIFTEEWLFGVVICQFWIGVDYTASTASILNLFILSLDRYWSVTSPLRYMRKRTKKRALIMISLVWFVSSLWLIPIIGWHHFEYSGVRTVPKDICDTEYATNTALKIVTGILNFYLPLAVMYGLYTKIFMEIRKRSKFEIGQRTSGCVPNHHVKVNNVQATSSLTEDSDHKSNCDSEQVQYSSPYVSSPEQRKFLNPRLTTTTEYETETSEDEYAKLHSGQYTNLTLVRLAAAGESQDGEDSGGGGGEDSGGGGEDQKPGGNHAANKQQGNNSDIEIKVEYFYDESVLDQKTERVHRFYDEHSALRRNSRGTAETSLSSPTPPSSVVVSDGAANEMTTGQRNLFTKQQSRPPYKRQVAAAAAVRKKQHRGQQGHNNNQRPPLTSLGRILHIRHKLGGNNASGGGGGGATRGGSGGGGGGGVRSGSGTSEPRRERESALRRQAIKWRERWLRQQRKHQAAKQKNQPKPKESNLKARAKKINRKMIRPSAALAKEIKAARQLGVIMGAFTLCFMPYFVLFMVVAFCDGCISNSLMTTMTWIGYLNSTMNPFLYPLCNMQFRRKFRKMLNLKSKDDRPVVNTNNSRYFTPRTSIAAYESRCHDY